MSRKSTSDFVVQVPTVKVRAVPTADPPPENVLKNTRPAGPPPEQTSVVMVWFARNANSRILPEAVAGSVSVLKVFAPDILEESPAVEV
jgi:hypothetical protein